MKSVAIANTNKKGQLVIPAHMRKQMGITEDVPLQISLRGNVIQIVPITGITTVGESNASYAEILKRTQGSWKDAPPVSPSKRKLELAASTRRKQAW